MKWETVIGLEVHAELSTSSKIFCGCTTAYGGEPNTHVCPVCAGMPGVLPVLNRAVVEYAARLGLALDCAITKHCKFDRKNYFYPDLPKAYQVSQLYEPICRDGHLDIELEGRKKTIHIREIHMEEDAGKLIHDPKGGATFMDFNRCGVPLLEIVSQPDFRGVDEVID
jgi:aspartyl-tRNA(Asn)/glutamyl-tRNA(Gln) amidotransferase subunit B